jgi:hypothetical protein
MGSQPDRHDRTRGPHGPRRRGALPCAADPARPVRSVARPVFGPCRLRG